MKQEERQLLLKDLSARVPYGVMVEQTLFQSSLADKEQRLKSVQANGVVQLYWYKYINELVPIHCVKPYLRSMSSMTEEEEKEYRKTMDKYISNSDDFSKYTEYSWTIDTFDFLNAHHLDYRGLIPMGLALEAPKDMYKL